MARLDYDRAADDFHASRAVPLRRLEPWRAAVARYLPAGAAPILDVGAGTGIWSRAFATWFGRPVLAVEPSEGMRARGVAAPAEPLVSYVGGSAYPIPLRTGSVGAAWLSTVIHHLDDLGACAAELRRVLVPAGPVLIRSSFPGRHEDIMLFRLFPEAGQVADTFPTLDETVAAFASQGLVRVALERILDGEAPPLAVVRDQLPVLRRSDSTLAPLTDAEFQAGLRAVDRAIAEGVDASPVGLDLLVLRAPDPQ